MDPAGDAVTEGWVLDFDYKGRENGLNTQKPVVSRKGVGGEGESGADQLVRIPAQSASIQYFKICNAWGVSVCEGKVIPKFHRS